MVERDRKFDCDTVLYIIDAVINDGATLKGLAKDFNVSINTIRKIVYRRTYDQCSFEKYGSIKNWDYFISEILYNNRRLAKGRPHW